MRLWNGKTVDLGKEGEGDLMKMSTFVRSALVSTACMASLAAIAGAQVPTMQQVPPANRPVFVESFWKQMPVGRLGVPLGTVVRVSGEAIDGSALKLKGAEGKILLRITTVNGRALSNTPAFYFERAPSSLKPPAPGEKFDYYVHEYGEFDGAVTAPAELGLNEQPLQGPGFGFQSKISIHGANVDRK
jgi:hypothetical protein